MLCFNKRRDKVGTGCTYLVGLFLYGTSQVVKSCDINSIKCVVVKCIVVFPIHIFMVHFILTSICDWNKLI